MQQYTWYNYIIHNTIKMKPVDIKSNTYIDSSKESNEKDPKLKISYIVRIPKYKIIFGKVCNPNWSEEIFMIKKVKKNCAVDLLLVILMEKELLELFT